MGGFRLGSIFGFEIRIDYSWFIIFFLILWTFGFAVFPATYPGQEPPVYLAMALVGTVLFFASIVAHELAHSLVARRKGIVVSGITLFIFGGMAHATMEFEEPGDEFVIAGVGPLSSLLISALFGGVALIAQQAGGSMAIVAVANYLAFINLALALFNLLPGFPLDGGRLFRAAVWKFTGDMRKATRVASIGGTVVGYLLILFGLLNFFAGNVIGGLWLVFIGWFMRNAAESSYSQLLLQRSLEGVRAAEVMTPDPYTVPVTITLEEFVEEHVFRGRHHAYPAIDEGRPVGIMTLARVRQHPKEEWGRTTVGEAMVPLGDGALVRPGERMNRVLEQLNSSETGRVLVTREEHLVGIITRSDLARWVERMRMIEG